MLFEEFGSTSCKHLWFSGHSPSFPPGRAESPPGSPGKPSSRAQHLATPQFPAGKCIFYSFSVFCPVSLLIGCWQAIFWIVVYHYVNPGKLEIVQSLKRVLSGYLYLALTSFVSVVSSTMKWLEFNPEAIYLIARAVLLVSLIGRTHSDESIIKLHLPELLQHPQLAHFLVNYMDIVGNETNHRTCIFSLSFVSSF